MNQPPEDSYNLIASSGSEIIGVKGASQSLGVSRATLLRWIKAKKIEGFFRIGSKWLIRKTDFDDFINKKIKNET